VLDRGCGPGPLAEASTRSPREVIGLTQRPEMLSAARALAAEATNIHFLPRRSSDIGPALGT